MVRIRRLLPLLLALLLALGARGEAEALPPPIPVNEALRAIRVTQLVLGAAELGEYEPAHPRAYGDGGAASGRGR